jgi:hypothetical protein
MKRTNRLLLGTAAGLVAASAAQAADLPLKAKPVQYVKICTLYGDGYYYIPGTDTCIRFGGYVQLQVGWNAAGGRTPAYSGTQGAQDRTVSPMSTRGRANIGVDTRTDTPYGTLRTLTSLHFQNENQTESFNVARAFIQWAGFSFGRLQSFADTWSFNGTLNIETGQANSDTGANGVNEIAYSIDLGNGGLLTGGASERRTKSLTNLSVSSALKVGAEPTDTHQGEVWPDPYVNLRVNQQWGYAAITGGAHNVNATYYSAAGTGPFAGTFTCPQPGTTQCGHPNDKVGFYVQGGAELKLPMLGPGDRIGGGARYAVGASGFGGGGQLSSPALFASGNSAAVSWISDGVYVNGSSIELTTTWTVGAAYQHFWTPTFGTAIGGNYANVSYDSTAQNYFRGALCSPTAAAAAATGATQQAAVSFGTVASGPNTCNPNFAYLEAGSTTVWTPLPNLQFTCEGLYTFIWSGFHGGGTIISSAPGARPTGIYSFSNQGIWSGYMRIQRTFNTGSD